MAALRARCIRANHSKRLPRQRALILH